VLARHFELMALDLDFAEQAGVLNRKHRLRGESLQQIHSPLRKFTGRHSAHHERANDTIGAEQRNDHARHMAGFQHQLLQWHGLLQRRRFIAQVGALHGGASPRRLRKRFGEAQVV
jgi:hypothetical protein